MADSREILLKLVRMAMGWESDFTLPAVIDWKQVLQIATDQGVPAILLDGYDIFLQHNPGCTTSFNPSLKLKAIGQLQQIEANYKRHIFALAELADVLNKEDVSFMLMKGFACGQYYPNPKHRPCGDIDIYPGEKFEASNEALKTAGVDVDPHYYRHSVSFIKDVMIENHRILADLRGPKRQTRALEIQLEAEAAKSIEAGGKVRIQDVDVPGAVFPSANFNALFLPWHVSAHFEFERVTLRHLLDWALFLVNEGKDIDVAMFREAKRKYSYGYSKLADIITNLSVRYLGMPTESIPSAIVEDAAGFDNRLADKVFDYMFIGQPRERDKNIWIFRLNNVKRIWQERWKYKEVYGMSVFGMLSYKVYGVLFKVGEEE